MMEIISLRDISTYSRCPAYYYFAKHIQSTPESKRIKLIRSVIQKCYLRLTQSNYRTEWRHITGWVDRAIYEEVDVFNEKQVEQAQIQAENILLGIRNWYDKVYLKENNSGYTDIRLTFNVHKFRIEDAINIVRIDEIPSLITIDDVEIPSRQLYNSLEQRGYGWLFTKEVQDTPKVKIEHLSFGPQGSFSPNSIILNTKDNTSTEKRMMNILYCMSAGVNYPSITSMCNQCQFRNRCSI